MNAETFPVILNDLVAINAVIILGMAIIGFTFKKIIKFVFKVFA